MKLRVPGEGIVMRFRSWKIDLVEPVRRTSLGFDSILPPSLWYIECFQPGWIGLPGFPGKRSLVSSRLST